MHNGSCLCGSVRYEAHQLVGPYVYCHCVSCRKSSGSAFAANIAVPIEGFKILDGADTLNRYESSPGKLRYFCVACGSPIYTVVGHSPSHVRVRLGTLDTDFEDQCSAHIFTGEKAPWHSIDGEARQLVDWPSQDDVIVPGSMQSASTEQGRN